MDDSGRIQKFAWVFIGGMLRSCVYYLPSWRLNIPGLPRNRALRGQTWDKQVAANSTRLPFSVCVHRPPCRHGELNGSGLRKAFSPHAGRGWKSVWEVQGRRDSRNRFAARRLAPSGAKLFAASLLLLCVAGLFGADSEYP